MPKSAFRTTAKTPDTSPTLQPTVSEVQPVPEPEAESRSSVGQLGLNHVAVNSPQTPPEQFSSLLGQMHGVPAGQAQVLRQLQHNYGNQYVGRVIQAKLTVGQPGDVYEQEADRVAEEVVRMPEPEGSSATPVSNSIQPLRIQQLYTACEDKLRRQLLEQQEEEEEEVIQAKEASGQTPIVTPVIETPAIETRLQATNGSGQPLPKETRTFMEARFGHDFSQVRVHTNAEAAETTQALNARAFTMGQNIVFGDGQYTPKTPEGRRLLAHELTHVVQQNSAPVMLQTIQRKLNPIQTIPKWTDLPSKVLADLKGLEAKLKGNPKLFNFMKAYQTDPLRRLTVLNLYVKLQDLNLWQFVDKIEQTTGVGDLEFLVTNITDLIKELKRRQVFTFNGSIKNWECRENRRKASIHFKHFEGWPDNKVQAHIDQAGWVFGSYSEHLFDWYLERKFKEFPDLPVGRKDVFAIRRLLLEQRKREKKAWSEETLTVK